MGFVPPDESIRIVDHTIPVEMCTEATCAMAMLSSLLPKRRGFTLLTCRAFATMRVGKNKLPLVQRLAMKVSSGVAFVIDKSRGLTDPLLLHPLQSAFTPNPDVADDKDAEENEHLNQSEGAERFELHRPGEQKNGFHIEDHEEDGNNVIADGVTATGAIDGIDAAFVGHQFGAIGILRANQFRSQKRDRNQNSYDSDE